MEYIYDKIVSNKNEKDKLQLKIVLQKIQQ